MIIAKGGLGLPNSYRQTFEILQKHQIIDEAVCDKMASMVGFRNISVHDYGEIKPEIVHSIVKSQMIDFETFYQIALNHAKSW